MALGIKGQRGSFEEPSAAERSGASTSGHRPLAEIDAQIKTSADRATFYRATDERSAWIQEHVTNRLLDERFAASPVKR